MSSWRSQPRASETPVVAREVRRLPMGCRERHLHDRPGFPRCPPLPLGESISDAHQRCVSSEARGVVGGVAPTDPPRSSCSRVSGWRAASTAIAVPMRSSAIRRRSHNTPTSSGAASRGPSRAALPPTGVWITIGADQRERIQPGPHPQTRRRTALSDPSRQQQRDQQYPGESRPEG